MIQFLVSLKNRIATQSERLFSKIWVRIVVGIVAVFAAIGSIGTYFSPAQPDQQTTLGQMIPVALLSLLALEEVVRVSIKSSTTSLPKRKLDDEEKRLLKEVKLAQKSLRKAQRSSGSDLLKLQRQLANLKDPKGKLVGRGGGVKVFERWIETPQGSGPIVGVSASAEDNTSINKRLSVTRMVTLGVFSLAAPKKSGGGHAYVVIEGPSVSGVATFQGTKNQTAGPQAFKLAATINNTARAAVALVQNLPSQISEVESKIAEARLAPAVAAANTRLSDAISVLPEDLKASFSLK
ncbi:MAG: hypothetical protein EBU84_13515 [Actinobacteria bacterium]|jgi:hypothetical protein|nr:hypothetical protein [Actinomycetota bacterium]